MFDYIKEQNMEHLFYGFELGNEVWGILTGDAHFDAEQAARDYKTFRELIDDSFGPGQKKLLTLSGNWESFFMERFTQEGFLINLAYFDKQTDWIINLKMNKSFSMILMVLHGIGILLVLAVVMELFQMSMIQSFWKIRLFLDLMKSNYTTGRDSMHYIVLPWIWSARVQDFRP